MSDDTKTIKNLLVGLFSLMAFSAVYFARDMFLPIVIGVMVALTLSPVVRSLARLGMPQGKSAVVLILVLRPGSVANIRGEWATVLLALGYSASAAN